MWRTLQSSLSENFLKLLKPLFFASKFQQFSPPHFPAFPPSFSMYLHFSRSPQGVIIFSPLSIYTTFRLIISMTSISIYLRTNVINKQRNDLIRANMADWKILLNVDGANLEFFVTLWGNRRSLKQEMEIKRIKINQRESQSFHCHCLKSTVQRYVSLFFLPLKM